MQAPDCMSKGNFTSIQSSDSASATNDNPGTKPPDRRMRSTKKCSLWSLSAIVAKADSINAKTHGKSLSCSFLTITFITYPQKRHRRQHANDAFAIRQTGLNAPCRVLRLYRSDWSTYTPHWHHCHQSEAPPTSPPRATYRNMRQRHCQTDANRSL